MTELLYVILCYPTIGSLSKKRTFTAKTPDYNHYNDCLFASAEEHLKKATTTNKQSNKTPKRLPFMTHERTTTMANISYSSPSKYRRVTANVWKNCSHHSKPRVNFLPVLPKNRKKKEVAPDPLGSVWGSDALAPSTDFCRGIGWICPDSPQNTCRERRQDQRMLRVQKEKINEKRKQNTFHQRDYKNKMENTFLTFVRFLNPGTLLYTTSIGIFAVYRNTFVPISDPQ